jgi:hypothetical protein
LKGVLSLTGVNSIAKCTKVVVENMVGGESVYHSQLEVFGGRINAKTNEKPLPVLLNSMLRRGRILLSLKKEVNFSKPLRNAFKQRPFFICLWDRVSKSKEFLLIKPTLYHNSYISKTLMPLPCPCMNSENTVSTDNNR